MPQDVKTSKEETPQLAQPAASPWFTTPEPIKRLFNKFPLRIYPANELPQSKSFDRAQHNLYIFTADDPDNLGSPSFNPSCLKWQVRQRDSTPVGSTIVTRLHRQAYLKFMGIQFSIVPSNNHASPTGALPFLLPSSSVSNASESSPAVPSTKLQRWAGAEASRKDFKSQLLTSHQESESAKSNPSGKESTGMRHEAYISLVDRQIRHTWVPRNPP